MSIRGCGEKATYTQQANTTPALPLAPCIQSTVQERRRPCLANSLSQASCLALDASPHVLVSGQCCMLCLLPPARGYMGRGCGRGPGAQAWREVEGRCTALELPCQSPVGLDADPGSSRHFHGLGRVCVDVFPAPSGVRSGCHPPCLLQLWYLGEDNLSVRQRGSGGRPLETLSSFQWDWAWGVQIALFCHFLQGRKGHRSAGCG